MYVKVSPMKGVVIFGKKGKLILCYVGPREIFLKVGKVANELKLPSEFVAFHPIFHVSMLIPGLFFLLRVLL